MSVRSLRPSPSLLLASLAVNIAAGGAAGAAIPGSDGTISGCYQQKSGELRVIDEGEDCRPDERMLRFNQQGPPGALATDRFQAADPTSTRAPESSCE